MLSSPYSYQLELFAADRTALGRALLKVDWEPAREWTRFAAVRAGRLQVTAVDEATVIRPIWNRSAGAPYVDGFTVTMMFGCDEIDHAFTTAYFARLARAAAEALGKREGLADIETATYLTTAYPARDDAGAGRTAVLLAREIPPRLVLKDGSLDELATRAGGVTLQDSGDPPAFLPHRLLDETARLTEDAGENETGGILIGHLHRDPRRQELFTEVTAQVPARHTEAGQASLTFTAGTWTDVAHAIALRGREEFMLGWWHSHPVREWCSDCAPERRRTCPLGAGFLSADDQALHRTVFPRAYSLALVVSGVEIDAPTFALFGWREGVLARRTFAVIGRDAASGLRPASTVTCEEQLAQQAPCRARAR